MNSIYYVHYCAYTLFSNAVHEAQSIVIQIPLHWRMVWCCMPRSWSIAGVITTLRSARLIPCWFNKVCMSSSWLCGITTHVLLPLPATTTFTDGSKLCSICPANTVPASATYRYGVEAPSARLPCHRNKSKSDKYRIASGKFSYKSEATCKSHWKLACIDRESSHTSCRPFWLAISISAA